MTDDKDGDLQKVGDMAAEINRLTNDKESEENVEQIRDLLDKMSDKLPD